MFVSDAYLIMLALISDNKHYNCFLVANNIAGIADVRDDRQDNAVKTCFTIAYQQRRQIKIVL